VPDGIVAGDVGDEFSPQQALFRRELGEHRFGNLQPGEAPGAAALLDEPGGVTGVDVEVQEAGTRHEGRHRRLGQPHTSAGAVQQPTLVHATPRQGWPTRGLVRDRSATDVGHGPVSLSRPLAHDKLPVPSGVRSSPMPGMTVKVSRSPSASMVCAPWS